MKEGFEGMRILGLGRVPDAGSERNHLYLRNLRSISEFSLGRRQLSGNPRVTLAGEIDRLSEGFEQRFDDVVGFLAVKQFQM